MKLGKGGKSLVVCVICWAKIDSHSDMSAHRFVIVIIIIIIIIK